MTKKIRRPLTLVLFSLALAFAASSAAFGAATITIQNNDAAGVGFNDGAGAVPVGGNTGTTLGQQRLIAFQAAADKWGATLTSTQTIIIRAQWTALSCNATGAVLGSAGALAVDRDFAGAPFTDTWYSIALTNKILGSDDDPGNPDINANFNINLGQPGCLTGTFFYLGLDGNHGTNVDLVTVLTHELGHGLGFQTFTSGSTGAQFNDGLPHPSVWDRFMVDDRTGESWFNMTNAERVSSAISVNQLAWNGPRVKAEVPNVLGSPIVRINSPGGIAGNLTGGPAQFGPALTSAGVTGNVVQALDPNDGAGPSTTDGCSALTNGAAVSGNIAIIDRGTCGFIVKVKNAQNAGAIGVIIADNAAGAVTPLGGSDPTITIPSERVTQADGNTIKANLPGVNATLRIDPTIPAGFDSFGNALLFAPNPFQSGSSVSHYDTSAFPNQLMEPAINADLTHNVTPPSDLTFPLFRDIGWETTPLPTAISKTTGDNQGTLLSQPFVIPLSVTTSPAVAGLTVAWTANASTGGANGTFSGTGTRFATSTTDALGVATAPTFTANGQAGYYSVNATVPGAGTTVFALRNMISPTAAPAIISGRIATPDGSPVAGVTINLGGARTGKVITDSNGNYRFEAVDTDNFYTVTPTFVNYHFAPASQSFSLLANKSDAGFTATRDAIPRANAIDTADFFVRQHYLDFLGREPDESGFNFWSNQILSCGADAACIERRTINVSAAYFLSIEFQQTGGLVDGLYRASYGRAPNYGEFTPDTATVAQGVVVGDGDWAGHLATNKQAFIDAWMQRPAFRAAYDGLSHTAFVDTLLSHTAGFSGSRDALVNGLNNGSLTRAAALRQVVENEGFMQAKRNAAFVMMQYFGYLRRDPDASGYQFWLNKLNQFDGNFEQAEMVKAFIVSGEYRARFQQ